ncbi:MAG: hypothetical protein WC400_03380 [Patescibacteria group bacterium]|jgi:hypothetical protein
MNDQTNVPQDMWPDEEPIKSQSMPINQPETPPAAQPVQPITSPSPTAKPKLPRKRAGWVSWVVTIIVLSIIALGGGYVYGKYWSNIQSWFKKGPTNEVTQSGPVEWQPIQPIRSLGLMKDPATEASVPGYASSTNPESLSRYYQVGKFIEGPYKDSELIVADLVVGGMGPSTGVFRIVKKTDGSLVVIGRQSPDLSDWEGSEDLMIDTSKYTVDASYLIPDLEMPDKLTNPSDSSQVIYQTAAGMYKASDVQVIKNIWTQEPDRWVEVFKNPVNDLSVWTNAKPTKVVGLPTGAGGEENYRHGFYAELVDGTCLTYVMKPTFVSLSQSDINEGVPGVVWTDTGKENDGNDDEYAMATVGGCGDVDFAAVMPDSLMSKLQTIGKTSEYGAGGDSDPIYGFKDNNEQAIKDLYITYTEWNQAMGSKMMTYQQFLATHPLFFWEDPFGRIIKFTRKDILPAAECGKPVIYLYPERTTRVSVKVSPVGGFSFTDPEYGTGWDVIAEPSGVLTEMKSQKKYPYLFWEGRGGLYQAPAKGWVVKQAEVSSFLDDKLAQLGLNAKETDDFKEFWLPRMQGAPYYFVGFWGTATMNQLAPLSITPKPDTVVRILMDFKPLQQPIDVTAPTIKTPERHGFTVIEWGGVIQ